MLGVVVLLVPRQIRMAGMTGDVPYYGGRFTPRQAYAAAHPPPPAVAGHVARAAATRRPSVRPPRPPRAGGNGDPAAALQDLLDAGVHHPGGVRRAGGPAGPMTGPVQVLVLGFEEPSFSGEVLAELTRLRELGVVRLVDVLLVERSEDGTFETLEPPPGSDPDLGRIAAEVLGGEGDAVDGESWSLADAVPPGGVAAVALIEHLWAEPLVAAIGRAGGRPLGEAWLPAGVLDRQAP